MSEKKNLKETLRAIFFSEEEQKVELATATLKDGTVVEAEAFEVGQAVMIVNGEEKMPAPAGDHILEDGRVMVVNEEGVIAEIKDAPAESEEEELSKEDLGNAIMKLHERLSKLEGQESLSKEDLETAKAEQAKKVEDQAKEINSLKSQITKLSSQAGAKPSKAAPQNEEKKSAKMVQLGSSTRDMVDSYYSNLTQN